MFFDEGRGNTAQVEALAAARDGGGNFLRLGRGKDEFHMRRRFLERFEKRVERSRAEHVHFVDEVDFEFPARGRVGGALSEVADIVHPVVAGPVDFDHIQAVAFRDFEASGTLAAGLRSGPGLAVQRLCQNAGGRCFTDASRTDKEVGLGESA